MTGNEEITKKERRQQVSQYTVSKTISKCLRSLNGGIIKIYVENQPFLKLAINQENIDALNLDFGEKFMEAATEIISSNTRSKSRVKVFFM